MKTLFKTLITSLFLIIECSAQGLWTMKTDKSSYSYGDSIQVSVTFSNNTDSTITVYESGCMVIPAFNTIQFQMTCPGVVIEVQYSPGASKTWTWVLIPSKLGIPTQDGKQIIYADYNLFFPIDSITVTAPKYYGGLLDVAYKLTTPAAEIQKIRDSLKAVIYRSDTLNITGTVAEFWQIENYSVDSLAEIYSKDSLFTVFEVDRFLGPPTETVTSIKQATGGPKDYALSQNYPNPFNPTTTISYSVPRASFVTIKVYDELGREIKTLVNEEKYSGDYKVEFSASGENGNKLTSGVYFYRMQAGSFAATKKLILLK